MEKILEFRGVPDYSNKPKMLHRVASLYVLALPLLATANVVPRTDPASQCEPDNLLCCDSVELAGSIHDQVSSARLWVWVLSPVWLAVRDFSRVFCSPITVVGIVVNPCTAQAVCCSNNSFGGALALACNPVDLSL
ncbi:hypothetical protein BD779DRAFT_1672678 [Infundibulicybe gibba]|nr:hypothetical protein BD779DRAFT_1672678 [Infundibulicybe gibba]